MAEEKKKDLVKRMVEAFWLWYRERYNMDLQHSSQQSYVVEYNTMKGIRNMLEGSYRSKNPNCIPDDDTIMGMWERILGYLREKNLYCYSSLHSIHRNYNTIIAMLMRHNEKEREKSKKAKAQEADLMQRASIIQQMMGGQGNG